MKWSIKLGRLWGIDVHLHLTFLLLLGLLGAAHWLAHRDAAGLASGLLFILGLFGCVLLHEYGHALMARRYGIPTRDITLLPIGGVARLERMPDRPAQELWVALAGPAVNVVIAIGLFAWLTLTGGWEPLSSLGATEGRIAERLLVANLFLAGFNLLPAFPMDGGRVLRALLAMAIGQVKATRIAAGVGKGMAILFGLVGLFTNPMLLLIAVFVWFGADQETAAAEARSSASGALVRDAMLTDFRSLAPGDSLGTAATALLAGSQPDFPVVEDGRLVGLLPRQDLFHALRAHSPARAVETVMQRDFLVLEARESLEDALRRMQPERGLVMPVMSQGRLVGLLTAENIGEFFALRTALAGRGGVPPRLPPPLPQARLTAQPPVIVRRYAN